MTSNALGTLYLNPIHSKFMALFDKYDVAEIIIHRPVKLKVLRERAA